MEYRVVLTKKEAFELSSRLKINESSFVKDEYTGTMRLRTDVNGVREKDYPTSVVGIVFRYSSKCELEGIKNVWFEYKWTDKTNRFEIEFEGNVPEEFRDRENVKGWDILKTSLIEKV